MSYFGSTSMTLRPAISPTLSTAGSGALLSKKSSKNGLMRRPLFLVRVESLVCTVEMIGPSRSAGAGMRSRASDAARLDASFCSFCEPALALLELRLLPISLTRCSPFSDVRYRIAQERVPTNLTCGAGSRGSASLPLARVWVRVVWAGDAKSPRMLQPHYPSSLRTNQLRSIDLHGTSSMAMCKGDSAASSSTK